MINSPPKVAHLAVDLHENLVQMPLPSAGFHSGNTPFSDLRGEYWNEPMLPVSDRFVANLCSALQRALDVSELQREPHHRQADHLRAGFEVTE
jgi:hypothetical protein